MSKIYPSLVILHFSKIAFFSNKPNPAALNNNKGGVVNGSSNGSSDAGVSLGGKACESCNGNYINTMCNSNWGN